MLTRLEVLLEDMETLDEPVRDRVFELLDGIDAIHRLALTQLVRALDRATAARLRDSHPAIAWLFEAYAVAPPESQPEPAPPPKPMLVQIQPRRRSLPLHPKLPDQATDLAGGDVDTGDQLR